MKAKLVLASMIMMTGFVPGATASATQDSVSTMKIAKSVTLNISAPVVQPVVAPVTQAAPKVQVVVEEPAPEPEPIVETPETPSRDGVYCGGDPNELAGPGECEGHEDAVRCLQTTDGMYVTTGWIEARQDPIHFVDCVSVPTVADQIAARS